MLEERDAIQCECRSRQREMKGAMRPSCRAPSRCRHRWRPQPGTRRSPSSTCLLAWDFKWGGEGLTSQCAESSELQFVRGAAGQACEMEKPRRDTSTARPTGCRSARFWNCRRLRPLARIAVVFDPVPCTPPYGGCGRRSAKRLFCNHPSAASNPHPTVTLSRLEGWRASQRPTS